MSTLAPVVATISRMTLPPVPMTSRILSLGIGMVSMRGAWADSSSRVWSSALAISPRMCARPSFAWARAVFMISSVMPATLMSICSEVTPSRRARDLEVHVAEMILVAEDVADHREVLAFEDQAHGDARDRTLQRNAGVHQRERCRRRRSPSTTSRCSR